MQPQPPPLPLQLWRAFPADLGDARALAECCAMLGEEEQARAQRFRFDRDRRSFAAGRALARVALSRAYPLPPQGWRFRNNLHGKPAAEPECEWRFNIANCEDLVVCLLAKGAEVGIDAEPFTRAAQIAEIAPTVFSHRELAQTAALEGVEREQRALSLWVLKEAYAKARGRGLSLPLKKFSFEFGMDGAIRLTMDAEFDDQPSRWRFSLLDCAGHRVALMVEAGPQGQEPAASTLDAWEVRPPQGSGSQWSCPALEWYSA